MYLYTHDIDKYTNVSIEIYRQKTGGKVGKNKGNYHLKRVEKKHVEEITAYTRTIVDQTEKIEKKTN